MFGGGGGELKSRLHPEGKVWPYHRSAVCNTLLSQNWHEMTIAARDYVTTSTSAASSEAWFSKMKPSLPPPRLPGIQRIHRILQTIQNQIIWKAQACWLFINILAATTMPKIKWHARMGGCALQPRNAQMVLEKSCFTEVWSFYLRETCWNAWTNYREQQNQEESLNICINRKTSQTDLQVIFCG